MNIEMELKRIKSSLESAKIDKAETDGSIDTTKQRFKDEYEVSSLKNAEDMVIALDKELSTVDQELEEGMKELSESYEW